MRSSTWPVSLAKDRLKALDEAAAMARLKPWVRGGGTVRRLLERRDRIVARFEADGAGGTPR